MCMQLYSQNHIYEIKNAYELDMKWTSILTLAKSGLNLYK